MLKSGLNNRARYIGYSDQHLGTHGRHQRHPHGDHAAWHRDKRVLLHGQDPRSQWGRHHRCPGPRHPGEGLRIDPLELPLESGG